jgi:hypothetical protein
MVLLASSYQPVEDWMQSAACYGAPAILPGLTHRDHSMMKANLPAATAVPWSVRQYLAVQQWTPSAAQYAAQCTDHQQMLTDQPPAPPHSQPALQRCGVGGAAACNMLVYT